MTKKWIFLALPLFAASACSSLPDWVGDTPAPKLEGERISVFKLESTLKPDQALENVPVVLPPVGTLEHKEFAGDLSTVKTISIGKGAEDGYGLSAVPLVRDNVIYTLDGAGNVSAHETAEGNKELWKSAISPKKDKVFAGGGLAYSSGKLFVTSGADEVVALNAADGKLLWRRPLGNVARAAPLAVLDGVFVITIDNHLYAIDGREGRIVWTHAGAAESIGVFGAASPVAAGAVLVAPYSSGEIYGLSPATGEELWIGNMSYSNNTGSGVALSDIDVSPVVSGDMLYAAGNAGVLYAVNALSSQRLWQQDLGAIRGIWAAGDFLYVIGGNNEVLCLHAKQGTVKWVSPLPRYTDETAKKGPILLSGPVLAGEKLLVSASNGVLFSLSPLDGKIQKQLSVPEGVMLPPVVEGGNVYLLSNSAKLAVIQ